MYLLMYNNVLVIVIVMVFIRSGGSQPQKCLFFLNINDCFRCLTFIPGTSHRLRKNS